MKNMSDEATKVIQELTKDLDPTIKQRFDESLQTVERLSEEETASELRTINEAAANIMKFCQQNDYEPGTLMGALVRIVGYIIIKSARTQDECTATTGIVAQALYAETNDADPQFFNRN